MAFGSEKYCIFACVKNNSNTLNYEKSLCYNADGFCSKSGRIS